MLKNSHIITDKPHVFSTVPFVCRVFCFCGNIVIFEINLEDFLHSLRNIQVNLILFRSFVAIFARLNGKGRNKNKKYI